MVIPLFTLNYSFKSNHKTSNIKLIINLSLSELNRCNKNFIYSLFKNLHLFSIFNLMYYENK